MRPLLALSTMSQLLACASGGGPAREVPLAVASDVGASDAMSAREGEGPDASDGGDPVAGSAACPPAGPFGTEVGDTVADLVLNDCDGNPVALHDLCDAKAAYLFGYADW